jgi:hypothetical protein
MKPILDASKLERENVGRAIDLQETRTTAATVLSLAAAVRVKLNVVVICCEEQNKMSHYSLI